MPIPEEDEHWTASNAESRIPRRGRVQLERSIPLRPRNTAGGAKGHAPRLEKRQKSRTDTAPRNGQKAICLDLRSNPPKLVGAFVHELLFPACQDGVSVPAQEQPA